MKKFFISVALISAIAIAAGYSMIGSDKSDVSVNDLTSANVEAFGQALPKEPDCVDSGTNCYLIGGWGKRLINKDQ